jgi:hypothetical protein
MVYTAEKRMVNVSGQEFESYLTEDGEVVFSQTSAALGLAVSESVIRSIRSAKRLKALQGDGSVIRSLRVSHGRRPISVVSMAELTELVGYLAERGHDRAVAMQQASFAVMLQASVDEAYGVVRERAEYLRAAASLAALIEECREKLRKISGAMTNPTLACNVYVANNTLIYGEGLNRDTYTGEDAHIRHTLEEQLEAIQAGMKLAGLSLPEVLELSHKVYHERLAKQLTK